MNALLSADVCSCAENGTSIQQDESLRASFEKMLACNGQIADETGGLSP